jgi:hypothetical protein
MCVVGVRTLSLVCKCVGYISLCLCVRKGEFPSLCWALLAFCLCVYWGVSLYLSTYIKCFVVIIFLFFLYISTKEKERDSNK